MRYSFQDDNPNLFFNTTLDNVGFNYDGKIYYSVNDCLNHSKYSSRMWLPTTVPVQQQVNLKASGIVLNEVTGLCYELTDNDRTNEALIIRIKAEMFVDYFEQVYTGNAVKGSKYLTAYQASKQLVESLVLEKTKVEFKNYWKDFEDIDLTDMNLSISGKSDLNKVSIPDSVEIVHLTDKAISSLNSPNKLLSMLRDKEVLIHCKSVEFEYSSIWFLIQNNYDNVKITLNQIDLRNIYTQSIGSLDVCCDVDWDKVLIK